MALPKDPTAPRSTHMGAYIGMLGYATLLAQFKTPQSATAAGAALGIARTKSTCLAKQFNALGLLHRVGWERPSVRGFDQAIYLLGPGPDAPARMTRSGKPMPHADFVPPINDKVMKFARFMAAIQEPRTRQQIIDLVGLSPSRCTALLAHLRSKPIRLAYVSGHTEPSRVNGHSMEEICYGPDRRDVPKPRIDNRRDRKNAATRARHRLKMDPWKGMIVSLNPRARPAIARRHERVGQEVECVG